MALYEKVIIELIHEIEDLPNESLTTTISIPAGSDNYKTLQKLLSKVIAKCYQSAAIIFTVKGNHNSIPEISFHNQIRDYVADLRNVFLFTKKLFAESQDDSIEKFGASFKIDTSWGQIYQQAIEHAIVQVLRHKMLIETLRRNELNEKLGTYAGK